MRKESNSEEQDRCPKCGGRMRRGERHRCRSGREAGEREGSREPESTQERIAKRAYELYVERGRALGHDLDDWLQAEREVCAEAR
jgi:hypothetical protein